MVPGYFCADWLCVLSPRQPPDLLRAREPSVLYPFLALVSPQRRGRKALSGIGREIGRRRPLLGRRREMSLMLHARHVYHGAPGRPSCLVLNVPRWKMGICDGVKALRLYLLPPNPPPIVAPPHSPRLFFSHQHRAWGPDWLQRDHDQRPRHHSLALQEKRRRA